MKNILFIGSLFLLFARCSPAVLDEQDLLAYADQADPELIKHHIAVLSDDSLKGRLPGTPEYDLAMNYVVDRYKSMGIRPLGDKEGSTYYQWMTLRTCIIDEAASYLLVNDFDTLAVGEEYFFLGNATVAEVEFEGNLVLAGYGIEAPQFDYNDFENLDVAGKVVVVFTGGPDVLPATERAHFSNTNTKIETLSQKGAAGIMFTTIPGGRGNFKNTYERISTSGIVNVKLSNETFSGRSAFGNMKFGGYFDWEYLRLLTDNKLDNFLTDYQSGKLIQPDLELMFSGKVRTRFTEIESANVVGIIEGNELKDEYVIHTAHLDHVGIGKAINGDSIYNGAHDNASGVSAMLEIARLYSELPSKPKRSSIFAIVTAEEMGLLGSKFLAENPVVPAKSIIANINADMPMMVGPLVSVEPLGAEQSNMMSIVKRTTGLLNLTIDEDHLPQEVRFVRSDNYNFVLAGIPSLRMKYGIKTSDSDTGLDSAISFLMNDLYHKPSDEMGESFNFDGAKTYVQLQFMNSYLINTTDARPTWNENSFFKRFER